MMRSNFVAVAREMIGTPFKHQGRLPGVGLDCAGLVVCAARESGLQINDRADYGRIPHEGLFTSVVMEHCDEISQAEIMIGDVMMFAFRSEPQHIAIVSHVNTTMLIHAYSQVGKVVENSLDASWQKRLKGCYRIRGLE